MLACTSLGLMQLPFVYPAVGQCPVSDPACICTSTAGESAPVCQVRIAMVGHLGEDWGSSMQLAGVLPRFNVSVALGTNAASGMNYSMPVRDNLAASDAAICMMLKAVATEADPSFPKFSCSGGGPENAASARRLARSLGHHARSMPT